jgi:uncharacterized protein (TIGR03435 family)
LRRTGIISIFAAFLLLNLLCGSLTGQPAADIIGNWQGTIEAGRGFRIILQISQADRGQSGKGEWQGVLYTMGPGGTRESDVPSLTLDKAELRFAIPPDGSFEGKPNPDGKSIAGTLKYGGGSYAISLARATPDTAWAVPSATDHMPADATPEFEVATIKPSSPDWQSTGFKNEGRRIWCDNETVEDIMAFAYGIHKKQIAGGPPWLGEEHFIVDGVPDLVGEPNLKQMQAMYRTLLTSRFNLAFHHETREIPAYVVRPEKDKPKIARSLGDPKGLPDTTFTEWNSQAITLRGTNVTMADFFWALGYVLEKPVVDQSGLSGRFDFTLRWAPDTARPDDPNAPPNIFTAMAEQLGLKLDATRAPADVLVVDHVDRPSPN